MPAVIKTVISFWQEVVKHLYSWVTDFAKKSVSDAFDTWDYDHSKFFIKGILCSVLKNVTLLMLDDKSIIWKSFKIAIVQVSTSERVVTQIAEAIVSYLAELAPIANFAVVEIGWEATISVIESVAGALLLPIPLKPDCSWTRIKIKAKNDGLRTCSAGVCIRLCRWVNNERGL